MANQSIEPILAKSATSGAPAIPAPVVAAVPKFRRPRRLSHLLEQEHILAGALLAPTLVILTLFIAYRSFSASGWPSATRWSDGPVTSSGFRTSG